MPLDWQGAGILLVINVLMISYITSRKKTIVPSQSLDSVQQQHACKDVRKFFILPKKSLYQPQNYNNNPQKPNNPQQNVLNRIKLVFFLSQRGFIKKGERFVPRPICDYSNWSLPMMLWMALPTAFATSGAIRPWVPCSSMAMSPAKP